MSAAALTPAQIKANLSSFFDLVKPGQDIPASAYTKLAESGLPGLVQENILKNIHMFGVDVARQKAEDCGLLPSRVTAGPATFSVSSAVVARVERKRESKEGKRRDSSALASCTASACTNVARAGSACSAKEVVSLGEFGTLSRDVVRLALEYACIRLPCAEMDDVVYQNLYLGVFSVGKTLIRMISVPPMIRDGSYRCVVDELEASLGCLLDSFPDARARVESEKQNGLAPLALHCMADLAKAEIEEADGNLILIFQVLASKDVLDAKEFLSTIMSLLVSDTAKAIRKWLKDNKEALIKIMDENDSFDLDFGHFPITSVPYDLTVLPLRNLHLDYCQVRHLPECLCQMPLQNLSLRGGAIHGLPVNFGNLKELRSLDLNHARGISQLPESFGELQNLRELNLSDTAISTLPASFANLANLDKLTLLAMEGMQTLPMRLLELPKLRTLTVQASIYDASPEVVKALIKKGCFVLRY